MFVGRFVCSDDYRKHTLLWISQLQNMNTQFQFCHQNIATMFRQLRAFLGKPSQYYQQYLVTYYRQLIKRAWWRERCGNVLTTKTHRLHVITTKCVC